MERLSQERLNEIRVRVAQGSYSSSEMTTFLWYVDHLKDELMGAEDRLTVAGYECAIHQADRDEAVARSERAEAALREIANTPKAERWSNPDYGMDIAEDALAEAPHEGAVGGE